MSNATLSLELTRDPEELKERFFALGTPAEIADLLEVTYGHLVYILYWGRGRYPYRTFEIPKRSGGVRQISAPPTALKILQSKLNRVLQLVYPSKPSAHGFLRERSIVSNALRHTGKRFVLNIDLEDFFPSINFGRVYGMFKAKPYNLGHSVATVLAQVCCNDNRLPQGAPTSPIVSNMICARLDGELQGLARRHRCTYTRYADDITISTTWRRFPEEIAAPRTGWSGRGVALGHELVSIVESNGFRVNEQKVRLQRQGQRQEVTGLTVNRFPNVRRRFVRQVRAMLHALEKYGREAAEREFREKHGWAPAFLGGQATSFGRVVRGKLDFLKMVKGEDDLVYWRLRNKLHSLAPDLIEELPWVPSVSSDAAPIEQDWSYWYEKYKPIIFQVEVRKDNGDVAAGTAFAYGLKTLATAAHNLEGGVYITPPFPEGEPASEFLTHDRVDHGIDVALVRSPVIISPVGVRMPVRDEPLQPGERVAALGYKNIAQRQPDFGIYRGYVESRATTYAGTIDTVQVSIEIFGGLSGAPVIDRGGNLVGIVIEVTFSEGTSENVPGRLFKHILPVRYLREVEFRRSQPQD